MDTYNESSRARILRKFILSAILLLSFTLLKAQAKDPDPFIIRNIKIIDGTGGTILKNMSVLIENGKFSLIDDFNELPALKEIKVIDGTGKTMIPGLIGVHNHLHIPGNEFLGEVATKLYLASGVTTIQTCGSAAPLKELELAKQIEHRETIGPEIIPSGPYITGENGNSNMVIPRSENELRETIHYWTEKGAKWFKVYRNIRTEDLKTIIDEAHKNGARVTGHLCSVTFKDAANLGIDALEHGFNSISDFRTGKDYNKCNGPRTYIDNLDLEGEKLDELLNLLVDKKVVLTSTLSIYESSIPERYPKSVRGLDIMSEEFKREQNIGKVRPANNSQSSLRENRLKRIMEFEYRFFKKGGILSAGVDAGRYVLPGFGDQRNYQLLREAGFTTVEAIQIMTGNGAKKLDRTDIGSIEVGLKANFVLLNGDLEADPEVIENVIAVYKDGIGYKPQLILDSIKGKYGTY